jgi:hypothetical protein
MTWFLDKPPTLFERLLGSGLLWLPPVMQEVSDPLGW